MSWIRIAFIISVVAALPSLALSAQIERVSVSSEGVEGDYYSRRAKISANGRYVVFQSRSANLVPADRNDKEDIFLWDRVTRKTELVSISSEGIQANENCFHPSVSADGRYVVFMSYADNLAPGNVRFRFQIYIRDRVSRTTKQVSTALNGELTDGDSAGPVISADGRFVAFESNASNLVSGDANEEMDIFVRDLTKNRTELISISTNGEQTNGGCRDRSNLNPSISPNGRFVAFCSKASNLVPGDTNGCVDVFVRDRVAGKTERVSVSTSGEQANEDCEGVSISADGRFVVFNSESTSLVASDTNKAHDVFVRDRAKNTTELVSVTSTGLQGNSHSFRPWISGDGRLVVFQTSANNFASNDTNGADDVFIKDRLLSTTDWVSAPSINGEVGNSERAAISEDGCYVVFESIASTLVPKDTNRHTDIFLWRKSPEN